jgi:hypothetical protein
MSPNTAFNFILVGLSLLYLRRVFIQYLGLVLFFVIVLNFLGYLYSIRAFYQVSGATPLPFYSALCFLLLSPDIFEASAKRFHKGADRKVGRICDRPKNTPADIRYQHRIRDIIAVGPAIIAEG